MKSSSTSSGSTCGRSCSRAHARAVFTSASEPRTEAPTSTSRSVRVSRTSLTIHVVEQLVDVHVLGREPELGDLVVRDRGLEPVERMAVPLLADDLDLLVLARVAEARAQEEAVELRLRERERALVLDRVLGRDQQERVGQLPRDAVDRDLVLGHRLEQRRLRLRHRAVDLVDEDDVREQRPLLELELARLLVEDAEAGDVGRLQVGRALDARRDRCRRCDAAIARASTVLAVPGTSSKSTWPPLIRAERTSRISSRLPCTTVSMFASSRLTISAPRWSPLERPPGRSPSRRCPVGLSTQDRTGLAAARRGRRRRSTRPSAASDGDRLGVARIAPVGDRAERPRAPLAERALERRLPAQRLVAPAAGRAVGRERARAAARHAREADRRSEVEERLRARGVEARCRCAPGSRRTFVSTGSTSRPKAKFPTAAAVYGPTPGSSVRSSGQPSAATAPAARWRLTARRL